MNWFEALLLGILQGLTEFLPVSSSGHLEIGKVLLGINAEKSLVFTVAVHGATVLSTIVVFRKDLWNLIREGISPRWNDSKSYLLKIFLSMVPVLFIGLFLREEVEAYFNGDMIFVGSMLLVTALLLASTYIRKNNTRSITFFDSLIIGIAQAIAVLPGISRSGATISTGLLLGNKKEEITRFSFLMVLIPVLGANFLDILDARKMEASNVGTVPIIVGTIAAFIFGMLACKWMIGLVKKGKMKYFAVYCLILGILALVLG